jgi:acyl-CoA dehydrogenase
MAGLGGDLKRKEKLTGRFADVFSWMLLLTATLRRYEADGRPSEDLAVVDHAAETAFRRMSEAISGIHRNLRILGIGWLLSGPVALWGRINPLGHGPHDGSTGKAARSILAPTPTRGRLALGIESSGTVLPGLFRLEEAFRECTAAAAIAAKLKDAVRARTLEKAPPAKLVAQAVEKGVITADEAQQMARAEAARRSAVEVDSFTLAEYLGHVASAAEVSDPSAVGR